MHVHEAPAKEFFQSANVQPSPDQLRKAHQKLAFGWKTAKKELCHFFTKLGLGVPLVAQNSHKIFGSLQLIPTILYWYFCEVLLAKLNLLHSINNPTWWIPNTKSKCVSFFSRVHMLRHTCYLGGVFTSLGYSFNICVQWYSLQQMPSASSTKETRDHSHKAFLIL